MPRFTGERIRVQASIDILGTKRPSSPKAVPVPAPPPVQRVPKPKSDDPLRRDVVRCWRHGRLDPGKRANGDARISPEIARIHAAIRGPCGRPLIDRLMRRTGLCGRPKDRHCVPTNDSNHAPPEHDQGLDHAAVMDPGSRRIVGWAMSPSIDTQRVFDAIAMARDPRRPPHGPLFQNFPRARVDGPGDGLSPRPGEHGAGTNPRRQAL